MLSIEDLNLRFYIWVSDKNTEVIMQKIQLETLCKLQTIDHGWKVIH